MAQLEISAKERAGHTALLSPEVQRMSLAVSLYDLQGYICDSHV